MKLKRIEINNFKGVDYLSVDFTDLTKVDGRNATGKTTLMDAFFWLMFGTNSVGDTEQKFDVRRLDSNGEKVHFTPISVAAVVEADDMEITLEKTQNEKWVKKRGQEEQVFSGNVNTFKINGFPKTQNEYKAFISNMVDEKVFRILSSPIAFSEMDWKEQRKMLLSMVEVSADEIGRNINYYETIASDLAIETPDSVKKKYTVQKNQLKKEQEAIPTKIGTLKEQIRPIDTDMLTEREESINKEIEDIQQKIFKLSEVNNNSIDAKIKELTVRRDAIITLANDKRNADIRSARNAVAALEREVETNTFSISTEEANLKRKINSQMSVQKEIDIKRAEYKSIYNSTFPETNKYCTMCGQELPSGKIETLKKEWEQQKNSKLLALKTEGERLSKQNQALKSDIESYRNIINESKKSLDALNKSLSDAESRFNAAMSVPIANGTELPEYKAIQENIENLNAQKSDMTEINAEKERLESRKVELKAELQHILDESYQKLMNDNLNAKIEAEEEKLSEVSQKIAECDKRLFALECYIKELSKMINQKFDGLEFKLFSAQVNGGINECCEITWNGVPYRSLNSGHRILAGLNIIKALQQYYNVSVPVWVDNAESLSTNNLKSVSDGFDQMIVLVVSDSEKLTVSGF